MSAQDAPIPEKLTTLKTSYKAAINRATAPLTKTYLEELDRLKIDYTKKGDLQAALAVDAEIKASVPSAAGSNEDMSVTEKKKILRSWLMAFPWVFGPHTLTFTKDDIAVCTDGTKWRYQIKSPTLIQLQSKEFQVDMSSDNIPLPGFGPDGGDRILRRIKPQ